ncbi:hypothetical protein, partial [Novosphingobium jiangmenense]
MPITARVSPNVRRKPGMAKLLAGVSIGAASLVLAASPVRAQAVNGTPTPQFGIGGISRSTPGLDAVFVDGSEALIDWSATDSGGVFLPEGNTLRFIYDGSAPYTVLNRVTDSAVGGPLSISGTVESSSLGKVWFYNAGGWVVGPKGVFNVGSLILTSLPITIDPASDTVSRLYGDKNEIRFGSAIDPKSSVSIQSGAQINATLANSSYVALVAPKIDQAGTVKVNGSAAYVAASAATMTINSGLFDIIVDSGSEDDTGISHTGSTTWAANDGSIDTNHGVYLVAVPKNQAMTAMVSGRLGYDSATTAEVVDGSIVLSAGRNVSGGSIVAGSLVGGDASLAISNLTVGSKGATNNLFADATGKITLDATTASSTVHGSATLNARGNIAATIDNANALVVEGDLSLASANGASAGNVTATVAGGGSLSVSGALTLSSRALGAIQTDPSNGDALLPGSVGENATSGNASLIVKDGNVSAFGTSVQSDATSGVGALSAGSATSGKVSISVDNSVPSTTRSVTLGDVTVSSSAQNGFFGLQQPLSGGDAVSGDVSLAVNGGAYSSTSVSVYSDALTYSGLEPSPLDATAGAVSVSFANLTDIATTGGLNVSNYASASDTGIATLGDVSLSYDNVNSRTAASGGQISIYSEAYGDLVTPNTVSLTLSNNSRLDTLLSAVEVFASGRFATGVQNSANVSFVSDASTLLAGSLDVTTEALSGVSGGNAISGSASAIIRNGSSVTIDVGATVSSYARGGTGVDGGSGTAGAVGFTLADSTYNGDLLLEANGVAGRRDDIAGASGTGTGGSVTFHQSGKTAALISKNVTLSSLGQGGRPAVFSRTGLIAQAGNGATGVGGTTTFGIADGTFTTSKLVVSANGEGGNGLNVDGGTPGAGGLGQGGTASFNVTGGLISAPEITVAASGFGGDGANAAFGIDAGNGGAGTGGNATASLTGGTIRTEFLLVEANGNKAITDPRLGEPSYFGYGGNEFSGVVRPGKGGTGTGGTSLLTIDGGSLLAMDPYGDIPPAVQVGAVGEGGRGGYAYDGGGGDPLYSGDGGNGLGGSATIRYLSGTFEASYIGADASGLGGLPGILAFGTDTAVNAANGGNGTGGSALFEIGTSLDKQNFLGDFRTVSVIADGTGGVGETGVKGGSGGDGTGGTARVLGTGGTITLSDLTVSAQGSGGNGGNGQVGSNGGRGGSGRGGLAEIAVDGDGVDLTALGPALQASGFGGFGGTGGVGVDGNDVAGNGGDGGVGTGGEVSFLARNLGKLSVVGFSAGSSFDASGFGGGGGLGGNAGLTGGVSLGNGGNGADGFGGTISVTAQSGGSLVFDSLSLTASGSGGNGGGRLGASTFGTPTPSLGGTGGAGQGGTIAFTSTDSGSSISADSLFASAQGLGGTGAGGAGFAPSGQSTDGSAGGNGTGGTFSLLADLEGSIALAAIDGSISISVHGLGGDGGQAENAIGTSGASGGNGGASGSGTGGTVQFAANRQGVATVGRSGTSTISADGTGGLAGLGGNGAPATEAGTPGGNGGNTGLAQAGNGGAVSFGADGGTLNFGALDATAIGTTQFRNIAASGGSGPGGSGLPGSRSELLPTGGTIAFSASDHASGGLGQINADAVTADVTSNWLFVGLGFSASSAAGGISLANSSTANGGGLHFGSFRGDASGFPATVDPALDVSVTTGGIVVDSDLTLLSGGNIALGLANGASLSASTAYLQSDSGISISADGTGRFSGGSIELSSFGSVGVVSTSCVSATCRPVEASGSLVIDSSGAFSLTGPVELAGLGSLEVYAAGDVTGDAGTRYFSNGDVAVRAGNDATIRNITGANVIVEAGAIADGSYLYFDGLLTLGEAAGGGQFDASGSLDLNSGGSIRTLDGTTFTAGRGIGVRSGNDILVGANNAFTANTGPSSLPDRIVFAAGGQTIDYSLAATDIATLSFGLGTTVDSGSGGVDLSGAAIDARSASFAGAFFRADVLDTLTPASNRRDDGGRLDPECLEGAICIGDVDATGFVSIGGGDFVPLDIKATGTINGDTVGLRATGAVTLGDLENTAQITAVDELSIMSLSGDIALLGNSGLTGATVRLTAAGNLTGTGNIEATRDDIGLSINGDIDANSLIAARELTTATDAGGETEVSFKALGSLRTGTLSLGTSANISASGEIRIGSLSLGGFDGVFSSGTALQVDSSSAVRNLSLTAGTVAIFGTIVTDGDLTIKGQSISGTSADAGGLLSLTSTDLAADSLQSAGDLTLKVTNEAALGTVSSTGGSVFIDPALLTFDSITSAGGITLGGGTITGGTVDAGTDLSVTATDALSLTSAKAGAGATLGAASLAVGDLSVGTDLFVDVSGQVDLTGTTGVGGNASIIAGTLNAQAIDATGNVNLTIAGTGTLAGAVTAGGDFFSSADSLGFDTIAVTGSATFEGGAINGTSVSADGALSASLTGSATLDSASAGTTLGITAASLSATDLSAGGDLTLTVTDTAALGTVSSTGGSVSIDPALLTFDAITANKGILLSGGTITGGTLDAGTSVGVTATGALTLASAKSGTTLSLGADRLQAGVLDAGSDLMLAIAKDAVLTGKATAGGNISAGFGTLGFTTLGATGSVGLEGTDLTGSGITAGTSLTVLLGGDYAVSTASAGTSLALQAASASGTSLGALGNLDATVTGLAGVTGYSAGGDLTITAGSLDASIIAADGLISGKITGSATLGSASAGTTLAFVAGKLSATSLQSVGDLTLTVTDTAALGTVSSTAGSVSIDPALLTFDAITANKGITLSGGTITGGTLDAGTSIDVSATGTLTFSTATAGTTASLGANLVKFDSLSSTGLASISGGAVDGGTLSGGGVSVDVTGSVAFTSASSTVDLAINGASLVGGTLGATGNARVTLTGNGDLGTATAGGSLYASGLDLSFTSLQGETVELAARSVIGGTIDAASTLLITADGAVDLDRSTSGSTTEIYAGSLNLPELVAGDLALALSGDATLGTVNATGTANVGAGALSFTSFSAGGPASVSAATITGGSASGGSSLTLSATGAIELASASAAGALRVSGTSITADGLSSNDALIVESTGAVAVGSLYGEFGASVTAGEFTFGRLASASSVTVNATSLTGGVIDALGSASVTAADSVTLDSASAGLGLTIAAKSLTAPSLTAGGDLVLTVTDTAALGTVTSTGGAVSIDPALLTFDAISAANSITLAGGTITGGTLDAGTTIDVTATGALTLTTATSGTTLSLGADSLQAGALDAGGDLSLTIAKSVLLTGAVNSSGNAAITAQGLSASSFDVTGNLQLSLTGDATLTGLTKVGGDFSSTAASLAFGTIEAGAAAIFGGGSINGDTVNAGGAISASLSGAATLGKATSGTSLGIGADSVDAGELAAGTDLSVFANGTIALGTGTAAGTASLNAATSQFTSLTSTGLAAIAGGAVDGGTLQGGAGVSVDVSGDVKLATVNSGADLSIKAANLDVGTLGAIGNARLVPLGNATLGTATAGGSLYVSALDLAFTSLSGQSIELATRTITGETVDATSTLLISADGAVKLARSTSGSTSEIFAGSLQLDDLSAADLNLGISGTATLGTVTANGIADLRAASLSFSGINATGRLAVSAGDIAGGTIIGGANVSLNATGAINLASVGAAGTLGVTGTSISAEGLSANDSLTVSSTGAVKVTALYGETGVAVQASDFTFARLASVASIGVTAGTVTGGVIEAFGDATVNSSGAVSLDSASAGFGLAITAQSLSAPTLTAGQDLTLAITGTAALGTVSSTGGSVSIDPALLTFDTISAANGITLSGGTITGGILDAGTDLSITATDALSLTSAKAGVGATLGAASLAVGDLSVGTDLFVDVSGQVDLTGTTGVGGNASIIAGTLNAQAIDATGNVNLTIAGTGTLAGAVTAGGDFFSSADSLGFDTIAVTGSATFEGGAINGTSVSADGALTASLTGSATLGTASAGTTLGITAASLSATDLSAGGDLTLTVTDTAALGTVSSTGGSVSIDPALLTFDAITANKGILLSGGTITGGTLDAGTSVGVTATGALTLASAKSGTTLSLGADRLQAGVLDAGSDLMLAIAKDAVLTGKATAGGNISAGFGTLGFTTLGATGSVGLEGTDLTGSGITAGTSLTVLLGGDYAVSTASAGTSLALQAASASGTSLGALGNLDATVTG